ncbi:hypothetical protein ABPG72_019971 [Tetrahymena utriculariae]
MQQLKIAQNNIYKKVINNLLNNITGQQATYIISKVPDYFSLLQQGELKQAYTKLIEIYNQLGNSKNKDLKIKKSQDNKMYKKFKELQSGYNKLKKNIKASEEQYKTQQQAKHQQQKAQKQQLLQQYKTKKQPKQQEEEKTKVIPLFEEKPISFKKQLNQFVARNQFKHTYSTVNGLETHNIALELLPHFGNQYINHIDYNLERILNILQQVQQRSNFPFKVKIFMVVETTETLNKKEAKQGQKYSIHAINTQYRTVKNLDRLGLILQNFDNDIEEKAKALSHSEQAPIGVRAAKEKIKSGAVKIKVTPQGRTKTNEKEQQQEENKKIHKEVSRNYFIRK